MSIQITFEPARGGPDQVQPVVGGQVPEMRFVGATFTYATGEAFEVIQAHRQPAASEPGPLVGEGELKQERLEREIVEWEAELRLVRDLFLATPMLSDEEQSCWMTFQGIRAIHFMKRRELDALTECGPVAVAPSPTNVRLSNGGEAQ